MTPQNPDPRIKTMSHEEFEKLIEQEVQERLKEKDRTFLPSAYKDCRRRGHKPEDIDYDMCHIFR